MIFETLFSWLILVALTYLVFVFVLSQIFIPNLGFKRKIKEDVPAQVKKKLSAIVRASKDKEEALRRVIDFQLSNFYAKMRQSYAQFGLLFDGSFNSLWKKKGFLHCHQQGFVLRVLLLNTGLFKEEDIKLKKTFCNLNIHQYLKINTGKKWVKVDPFAMSLGFKIGEVLPHLPYRAMRKRNIDWRKNFDKL